MRVKLLSHVRLFATPWTVVYQAPLSMEFSRQEYWSGLPFPSPGDLPNLGIKPGSPTLQADALPSEPPGKPIVWICHILFIYASVDGHLGRPLIWTVIDSLIQFFCGYISIQYISDWHLKIRTTCLCISRMLLCTATLYLWETGDVWKSFLKPLVWHLATAQTAISMQM